MGGGRLGGVQGGGGGLSLSTDIPNSKSETAITDVFVAFSPSNSTLRRSFQLLSWFDLT